MIDGVSLSFDRKANNGQNKGVVDTSISIWGSRISCTIMWPDSSWHSLKKHQQHSFLIKHVKYTTWDTYSKWHGESLRINRLLILLEHLIDFAYTFSSSILEEIFLHILSKKVPRIILLFCLLTHDTSCHHFFYLQGSGCSGLHRSKCTFFHISAGVTGWSITTGYCS